MVNRAVMMSFDDAEPGDPMSTARRARVFVLSELYRPELTSTGYYVTRIAERLAQDHEVRAICGQPTYAERGRRAARNERRNEVQIHRVRSTTFDKDRLGLRMLNVVSLTIAILGRMFIAVRPGDVVIAVTNPPLLPMLGAFLGRVRRVTFIPLIHDRYPEIMVATGLRSPRAPSVRILGALNHWAQRAASVVVVVGRDQGARIAADIGAERVKVISNWAEDASVRPVPPASARLRHELGLPGQRVVLYAGNFGRANDLENLLEAAALLRDRDVTFALIGTGAKRGWVEEQIVARSLLHVHVAGPFPRERQCELLAAGDIVVIPSIPGMHGISVPSRVYNSLAAGKPVIVATEPDAEIARIVEDFGVGWVVPPGRPADLAVAIEAAFADPDRQAMGERASQAASGALSETHLLDEWSAFIRPLVDTARGATTPTSRAHSGTPR